MGSERHCLPPDVADILVEARARLGETLREAAAWVGISPGFLCDLEHAKRAPSIAVAVGLAFGLGLFPDEVEELLEHAQLAGRSWSGRVS